MMVVGVAVDHARLWGGVQDGGGRGVAAQVRANEPEDDQNHGNRDEPLAPSGPNAGRHLLGNEKST